MTDAFSFWIFSHFLTLALNESIQDNDTPRSKINDPHFDQRYIHQMTY